MNVFLVRHAESVEFGNKWQTPQSPLSPQGRQQSQLLSSLSRFRLVDIVLSSKWTRAKETAQIIAKNLGKPLELIQGIHEREQPVKIYGSKISSKASQEYIAKSTVNMDNLDWKFTDGEESFREVSQRAAKFKSHLEKNHLSQTLLV
ncbi:MAG: histidine phosphatase family protein, partial [Patescibacteria group bacterium]